MNLSKIVYQLQELSIEPYYIDESENSLIISNGETILVITNTQCNENEYYSSFIENVSFPVVYLSHQLSISKDLDGCACSIMTTNLSGPNITIKYREIINFLINWLK